MKEIVRLTEVSVSYGGTIALENASLSIYDDDFIGVIGPNGGGKTTLVKAITGAIPYRGKIVFDNVLMRNGKPLIGYMPQQTAFDRKFPISVEETVLSGLQSERGFTRRYTREDRRRAAALIEQTHIQDVAKHQISEVSGGQMQRALLCRAVISSPKLLILDEPTNFVDNRFENELYDLLRTLNERMAVVMVSHDIGTITSVVKSIVCVNRHVHRHDSNVITPEQLENYRCPIQIISHGTVPHTVLCNHDD